MDEATAAAMPRLTVNLVSDPNRPEFKDANGNAVNWDGNVVEDAVTGGGADRIHQSPSDNRMFGGGGSDTYTGFEPNLVNGDYVSDSGGTADVLDLSSFPLWNTSWRPFTSGSGTNTTHSLQIGLTRNSACLGDNCQYINFSRYFDNTGTNKCEAGPGAGLIEAIKFADDPNVDFAQVKSLLGCS